MAPKSAGTAVITDFWRVFDKDVIIAICREMTMISMQALLLYSPGFSVPQTSSSPHWDIRSLSAVLEEGGFQIKLLWNDTLAEVYELQHILPQ
jgi:hypothetical protein